MKKLIFILSIALSVAITTFSFTNDNLINGNKGTITTNSNLPRDWGNME